MILKLLLSTHELTSYFPTRTPTKEEATKFKVEGDYLELTAKSPIWDPTSTYFSKLEERFVDSYGEWID